jgi:cholesterol transport system auxiliary component
MKLPSTGLLILVFSGCSILPKPQPWAVHDFGLPYSSPSSTISAPTQPPPITVEAPKWLVDNRIHYRLLYASPTQVRFYALDRWIAPPPELFEQLLNSSAKHRAIPFTIGLQVFEQQFVSSSQAQVLMHFSVTTDPDAKNHQSIKQDFHLQLPCSSPDAKGAVTGFTRLSRQAVDKVQAWLTKAN